MPAKQSEFIVIGATLPRTGTLSLMVALRILLRGKVTHMCYINHYEKEWERIYSGKATDGEFKQFFLENGFIAGVDSPFCFHYKQALRAYPNAKVILSTRDPLKWRQSVKDTVCNLCSMHKKFPLKIFNFKFLDTFLLAKFYFQNESNAHGQFVKTFDRGEEIDFYKSYQKEVKEIVPAYKLLEYNISEGWEPLCRFLQVSIPNCPFPHVNDTNEFQTMIRTVNLRAWMLLAEIITFPICVTAFYYHVNYGLL